MDYTVAMQRAIALAEKGLGKTAPNPIVGAVIIDAAGNVVGEGFHDRVNSPDHAEVVAIKAAGNKAVGATIVVTLEPCNHTGSTGPCVQAIIAAGITTVVFAVADPNAKAAGGADALRTAGVSVIEGILKDKYGFQTEIVLNASLEEMTAKLYDYNTKKFNPQDQLFVFFAGHGYYDDAQNRKLRWWL
jgi:diaminohydroxyphosphoribosylaminopyrimidine deaminase/5-amino-6-(5-phosphoribosylamino)uracil reductase